MHSRTVPTLVRAMLLALVVLARPVAATTIVVPSDAQLIRKSPLIVTGTVVRSSAVLRNGGVWTETLISRDNVLKGDAQEEIVVREVGGQVGDRLTVVYGAPRYKAGEHVLVFLTPTPRGDYQTVDLFIGKFARKRAMVRVCSTAIFTRSLRRTFSATQFFSNASSAQRFTTVPQFRITASPIRRCASSTRTSRCWSTRRSTAGSHSTATHRSRGAASDRRTATPAAA